MENSVTDSAADFYDLGAIFALRDQFAGLDPAGEARAVVASARLAGLARLAHRARPVR